MISVQNKAFILKHLNANFPAKKVKGSANPDGTMNTMVLVVDGIDCDQLNNLSLLSRQSGVRVALKRSGTGISIKFN